VAHLTCPPEYSAAQVRVRSLDLTWVEKHSGWSVAGFCFSISCCPRRFDLHDSHFSQGIMTIIGFRRVEIGLTAVTTEGEEVGLAGLLETLQATGHKENLHP
jgi:hypothetical protein